MKFGPFCNKIVITKILLLLFLLSGCQKSAETVNFHAAIVGIPSKPIPNNWQVLQNCLNEVDRLNPDVLFVSGDWQFFLHQMEPQRQKELSLILEKYRNQIKFIPSFNKNLKIENYDINKYPDQKFFYSFSQGNNLFLVLESSDSTSTNIISPRQIRWLSGQKKAAEKTRNVTLLLNRPIWDNAIFPGPNNWWNEVHPLLLELNVKSVIAGYRAHYSADFKKDDIRYIQSAGASENMSENFWDLGNFSHFLWLTSGPENYSVSPVRIGSIPPDSVVMSKMTNQAKQVFVTSISHPEFELPSNPSRLLRRSIPVKISNPFPFSLRGELSWMKKNSDWRIYPPKVTYDLEPNQAKIFNFNIWMVRLNSLNRNLPYLKTEIPPLVDFPPRSVIRYLIPVKKRTIFKNNKDITIDGNLNEWSTVAPLLLDKEYLTTGISSWIKDDLSVSVYSSWDESGLFLGIDVRDDKFFNPDNNLKLREGDCVELGFDGKNDQVAPGFDADDHNFGFAFTTNGPVAWRWYGPQKYSVGQIFSIPFKIIRLPGHTVYEIFLPEKELSPIKFQKNYSFGFTVVVHDNDGSGWEGAMQWTAGLYEKIYPALFGDVTLK